MVTPLKTFQLRPPKAPNLPIAPVDYTQTYQDQLLNALRLYFNQIDNFGFGLSNTTNGGGGSLLTFPNGAFHQDGTTTLTTGISNVSTTPIVVASTVGFPSSGWILIGSEIISYTTTTATTFDGTITRGVLGTTNVAHTAGTAITEAQGTGGAGVIGKMLFNNTATSNQVYVDPTDETKVVFATKGLYNVQFSAQLLNFTTSEDNVTIWLRQNGSDVAATAGIQEVAPKHGTSPGATIAAWNYFVDVNANDYIQLAWASDTGNTVVATYPAGTSPVHPVSPGVILTVTFVSAV
mgnify:CR=1 FL=1